MKTTIILVLIIISFSNELLSNKWKLISPLPTGYSLNSIDFINSNIGWAVGEGGTILKTTNGGQNWFFQNSGTSKSLQSIKMNDENNGWISSYKFLLKTTDGGNSWQKLFEQTDYYNKCDVSFIDNNTGWVITSTGIYKTTDGGINWTKIYRRITFATSSSRIQFINKDFGWASGDGIFKTTNGGKDWTELSDSLLTGAVNLFFVNQNVGWANWLDYRNVFKTTDGGIHWILQLNILPIYFNVLYFANENIGWIAGSEGYIGKTTNGGQIWERKTKFMGNTLYGLDFVDSNIGWCCGTGGIILKTTDGGETWFQQAGGTDAWLNKIYFSDKDTGWVFGSTHNGILFSKTTDGGKTWVQNSIRIPGIAAINNVYIHNSNIFWIVSNDYINTILCSTTDSGINWRINDSIRISISDINFFDSLNGYASTYNMFYSYRTSNGGNNWILDSVEFHPINTIGFESIIDLFFINKDCGWSVSYHGQIYKSTDSGKNWYKQYWTKSSRYNYIYFLNSQFGWVLGDSNSTFRTTDGGNTWYQKSPVNSYTYFDITFSNDMIGWICSLLNIYKTTDGGDSWVDEFYVPYFINSIFAVDDSTVYAAGSDGRIYKYIDEEEDDEYNFDTLYTVTLNSYPNPTNSDFTIDIPDSTNVKRIIVYDILGNEQSINYREALSKYKNSITINCSQLSLGIYFLRIFTDSKNYTIKFQVTR